LGDIRSRLDILSKESFHQGAIFLPRNYLDDDIGGLRGRNRGRLPKAAIGKLKVEATLAGKDDPQRLGEV
jgi:hypothetical protein